MKSALIFETGRTQVVLTPETAIEEKIIEFMKNKINERPLIEIGSFYQCRGGWSRWSPFSPKEDDRSFILVFDDKAKEQPTHEV